MSTSDHAPIPDALRVLVRGTERGNMRAAAFLKHHGAPGAVVKGVPPVRFAIVCMGRTGSTMLQTMLASHPDIRCFGEVFHPQSGAFARAGLEPSEAGPFLDQLLATDDHAAVGFKLPWDSMLTSPQAWSLIRERRFRVILLRRRNILDQYISMRLAGLNGVWHSYSGRYERRCFVAPVEECRGYLQLFTMGNMMLGEMSRDFVRAEVVYEDILDGSGLDAVFALLGVDPHPLVPGVERLRFGRQCDAIENYDELKAAFAGTPWIDYFED